MNVTCLCSARSRLRSVANIRRTSIYLKASAPSALFYYLHSPLPHVHYVILARRGFNNTLYRAFRTCSDFNFHFSLSNVVIQEIFGSVLPSPYQERLLRYNPTGEFHIHCLSCFAEPECHYIGRRHREFMFVHRKDWADMVTLHANMRVSLLLPPRRIE
jgi:hypothetical protein